MSVLITVLQAFLCAYILLRAGQHLFQLAVSHLAATREARVRRTIDWTREPVMRNRSSKLRASS